MHFISIEKKPKRDWLIIILSLLVIIPISLIGSAGGAMRDVWRGK